MDIARELDRIQAALRDPQTDERYCQLYAAQQALAWAISPSLFMSPFETIQRGLVRPISVSIPEDSANYSAGSHPPQSSKINAQICCYAEEPLQDEHIIKPNWDFEGVSHRKAATTACATSIYCGWILDRDIHPPSRAEPKGSSVRAISRGG